MPNQGRKIRFIEPGGRPGRGFNAWIRKWPLLGPVVLSSILHEKGYDVAAYNENACGPVTDDPHAYADICSADVVGISIMTSTAARGYALAARVRKDAPGATIVFGGVHASFLPDEALPHGDIVVVGEAENVIEQIASGAVRKGILRPEPPQDLDRLPPLNYSLLRGFDRILSFSRKRELYEMPMMTSRGCPHNCTYCSVTRMFGRKVRRQSVEKVYSDVRYHMEKGFRKFFFYDDNFTADREWTRQVLERLSPLHIRFNAQTRADFAWQDGRRQKLDTPLIKLMRKGGADVMYVGYETIDEHTADHWHKGYRGAGSLRGRLLEDTNILHSGGFWIHAMFVLGPHHSAETADNIVRFARQGGIESLQISVLTPFPGTPLFEEMKPNILFNDFPSDWDYFDGSHCVYDNSVMGFEGLQRKLLQAHQRFYSWGGWSVRRLRALFGEPIPPLDKIRKIWTNARIARWSMQQFKRDTVNYLHQVRQRLALRDGGSGGKLILGK